MEIKRGQVWYADLSMVIGAEQGGIRPVLILQNDMGNRYSPTTIIAPLTTVLKKKNMPTHIETSDLASYGLPRKSLVLLEQIKVIDKSRLKEKVGELTVETMVKVGRAVSISLGLN